MNPWAIVGIVLLSLILVLFISYIILIRPNNKRGGLEKYKNVKYAHRGLHGGGVPENSLTAFRLAVETGYGIELDVHSAKDGVAVVFHDGTLNRMVGKDAALSEFTAEELSKMNLSETDEKIPTFQEVLELVGGKVPLLVELKQDAKEVGVAKAAAEALRQYTGDFIVESFNPFTLAEFGREMPEVRRGILSQNFTKKKKYRTLKHFLAQSLIFNVLCKPDFISFKHEHANFLPFRLIKAFYNPTALAWTVCSEEDEERAYKNGFDTIIFEGYTPKIK